MMLLAQKESGEVKGRLVGRGDQSHDFLTKEETASPTVSQDGIEANCTIDAYEGQDIQTYLTLLFKQEPQKERIRSL
jgi:hypothetical protein